MRTANVIGTRVLAEPLTEVVDELERRLARRLRLCLFRERPSRPRPPAATCRPSARSAARAWCSPTALRSPGGSGS